MPVSRVLACLALASAAVLCADAACAGTLTIRGTAYRIGQGGEFRIEDFDDAYMPPASVVTAGQTGQFYSFCLERNEYISLSKPVNYYTYAIDTGARNGGEGGQSTPSFDPLDERTAKLYYTFWTNKWSAGSVTYDYTVGAASATARDTDGAALQDAIWWIEGELPGVALTDLSAKAQAMIAFATNVTWSQLGQSSWTGIGLVRVLNLSDSGGAPSQSQLVVVPLPEGALMGFALLGALGLFMAMRRRNRHSFR